MTKRKSPEENASDKPTSRKRRKRVAFSAPKDAATKALIKENALTSPLLRLPLEIRNKIWTEVLGDRLVHLKYSYDDEMTFEENEENHVNSRWSHELNEGYGNAWRHLVCEEDCSESQQNNELITLEEKVGSVPCHSACVSGLNYEPIEPCLIYKNYCSSHEMMRLSVLRSCRQIYVEANQILWSTNTFSFDEATAFKRFMMTRNVPQKRLIRCLRLHMRFNFHWTISEWNKSLNMSLLQSLSGLRQLRLHIVRWEDPVLHGSAQGNDLPYPTVPCEGLKRISTLPLTEVEVAVKNPQSALNPALETAPWTKIGRDSYAQGLRQILLNPKGAELYAEEQLKLKEERRKNRENDAEIKASMSRPRLQPDEELISNSRLAISSAYYRGQKRSLMF